MAYLTHDLAVLYIGASVLLLLYYKRVRDMFVFIAINTLFALPWLVVSALIYKKPSTFVYYPISVYGIPQIDQKDRIIQEFLHTSPLRLIAIRLESLFYLLTPYQFIVDENGQSIARRIWACTLFSVPGAMGFGLILPAIAGAFKKIRNIPFWILSLVPIVLCTVVIGWTMGLGALHFAEASVVLFIGLGVWFLLQRKSFIWLLLAYIVNCMQAIFFGLYSYNFQFAAWFTDKKDIASLVLMIVIMSSCGWLLYKLTHHKRQVLRSKTAQ